MELMLSRPLGPQLGNLEIYKENEFYILISNNKEVVRASGENASSMMTRYFNHYYNTYKDSFYPEMPYRMNELDKLIENNNILFNELNNKYAHLEESERLNKVVEEYIYFKKVSAATKDLININLRMEDQICQ